jgi:RNA polymerase II elongation factor ELL
MPDYERKYKRIMSKEQRYAYKADFNMQYDEYRRLHSSIEKVANIFEQLRQQLKQHEEGSDEYESTKQRILSEYKQVKNKPKYVQQRQHCDYLHKKLGHIKSLIQEFDNRQRSGPS